MKGEELWALADSAEAATGPDREIDLAIHLALDPEGHAARIIARATHGLDGSSRFAWELGSAALLYEQRNERGDCYSNGGIPILAYTASLDAALTLVPEGCWAEGSFDSPAAIEIHAPMTYDPLGRSQAATPALALTVAALRARALSGDGGGE